MTPVITVTVRDILTVKSVIKDIQVSVGTLIRETEIRRKDEESFSPEMMLKNT